MATSCSATANFAPSAVRAIFDRIPLIGRFDRDNSVTGLFARACSICLYNSVCCPGRVGAAGGGSWARAIA